MRIDVQTVRIHTATITGDARIPIRDCHGRLLLPESISWRHGSPDVNFHGYRILDGGGLGSTDTSSTPLADLPAIYRQHLLAADPKEHQ